MERQIFKLREHFYLNFENKNGLGFCAFIEEIKKDLLKIIAKNRSFIGENRDIHFGVIYNDREDKKCFIDYDTKEKFCINGISTEKFVKDLLNSANEYFKKIVDKHEWGKFTLNYKNDDDVVYEEYLRQIDYDRVRVPGFYGYYDKECDINKFDNNFTIEIIDTIIPVNPKKVEHKDKFYNDLYDDLMRAIHKRKFYKDLRDELIPITWHPSRYLDWCVEFNELKFLEEEVWGNED